MSKRDLLGIIAKNMSIAAADSITTAVVTGDSAFALGNLASATGKTIEEVKKHLKDSNDGLYHMHVATFFETADVDPEKFEQFIKDNPNEVKLGAEFLKILEKTLLEDQAKMYARAFSLYVKGRVSEAEMNKYVYIIGKLDRYLLSELEKLKQYKQNPKSWSYTEPGDPRPKINTDEFVKGISAELATFGFIRRYNNISIIGDLQPYVITDFYIKFKKDILEE